MGKSGNMGYGRMNIHNNQPWNCEARVPRLSCLEKKRAIRTTNNYITKSWMDFSRKLLHRSGMYGMTYMALLQMIQPTGGQPSVVQLSWVYFSHILRVAWGSVIRPCANTTTWGTNALAIKRTNLFADDQRGLLFLDVKLRRSTQALRAVAGIGQSKPFRCLCAAPKTGQRLTEPSGRMSERGNGAENRWNMEIFRCLWLAKTFAPSK